MSFQNLAQTANRGISDSRNYLDQRANAILRPKTAQGVGGFVFDVSNGETVDLSSDVTDHVTEDNSFVQDHVVNKPITLSLSGFIGELFFKKPAGVSGAAQEIQNRLETVEAFAGEKTPGAIQTAQRAIGQAQRAVSTINQALDRVQNVVGLFDGQGPEATRQQKAYQELFALRARKSPVTVQTPWAYYDSMIITDISFSQGSDSEDWSDISVSLKEFRVSETKTTTYNEDLFPPREEIQSGESEDQGSIRGRDENVSLLFAAREALIQ
jgi:hypothetical protein